MRHCAPTFETCPANPRVVRVGFVPGQQSADLALCLKAASAHVTALTNGIPAAAKTCQHVSVCLHAVCRLACGAMKVAAQNHECGIEGTI